MRKALALVVMVFLGAVGGRTEAQTSPRDEARAHFAAGESRFKAGDYRAAISEFRAADRLVPSPILAYNVALCYDKLGDAGQAAKLYREYLERRPDAPNRPQVEQRLAALAPPPSAKPGTAAPDGDGLAPPLPGNAPHRRSYDDAFAKRVPVRASDAEAAPVAPPPPIAVHGDAEQAPPIGPPAARPSTPEPLAPPPSPPPGQPPPPPVVAEAQHQTDSPIYTKWYFWVPIGVAAVILIDVAVHAGDSSSKNAANGLVLFHF